MARVNKMLGRIYSVALAAIMTEALVNGIRQIALLKPLVFWISASAVVIVVAGVAITQWFAPSRANFWLGAVPVVTIALLLSWPLHFDPSQQLAQTFQPWIWWTLGISSVAAGTTYRFAIGVAYVFSAALGWLLLKTSSFGGSGNLIVAGQEAFYLFLYAAIVIALVLALRWEAGKTDSANQNAILSAVKAASADAVELERSRLDALVHDSVLTTLLVASRAESADQIALATKSAKDAIAKLGQERFHDTFTTSETTLTSFFSALQQRIRENAPVFLVSVNRLNDLPIPSDIATALTEATLQAVDNSMKHAGTATERSIRLRGYRSGLKIVISDNGRGFRPSKVPKVRIGISSSIVGRVSRIDGRVSINASPGTGTTVVIEWGRHD